MIKARTFSVICSDGYELAVREYGKGGGAGCLILANALGVFQPFYRDMARFFTGKGYGVLTFDYRGTGKSRQMDGMENHARLRLEDWGRLDMDALMGHARNTHDRIFLMGHSVGGQLSPLADGSRDLAGLILVGASFPHWRRWAFPHNLYMLAFWYGILPALGLGRRYFPSRMLGLSRENLPAGLVRQWGQWARTEGYVTSPGLGIDVSGFDRFTAPVLAFGFDDDTYAPQSNIQRLHQALPRARIHFRFLEGRRFHQGGMGHFGFFKADRARLLWEETALWMSAQT